MSGVRHLLAFSTGVPRAAAGAGSEVSSGGISTGCCLRDVESGRLAPRGMDASLPLPGAQTGALAVVGQVEPPWPSCLSPVDPCCCLLSGEGIMCSRHMWLNLFLTARIITYPTVASQLLDISNISSLIKAKEETQSVFVKRKLGLCLVWAGAEGLDAQ